MRSWVQLSLFVAVTALFAVGCGDDDGAAAAIRLGGEGDSCTRTGDCSGNLACVNNFCTAGGGSGQGGDDAGGGAGGNTGPALGGEGESCQARRDCQDGLLCIENRCAENGGTSGAGGATAPRLGSRGESCESAGDCANGLTCVPRGFTGVCDLEDFGLEPSGNVCSGECEAAADCCELPPNLIAGVRSCASLVEADMLAGGLDGDLMANCPVNGPVEGGGYEVACFYYRTYCQCAASTWSCDNSQCTYTKPACEPGYGQTWDGCPAQTRSGRPTPTTTCNAEGTCEATPVCEDDLDCNASTSVSGASCAGSGCTCYANACYLKCNEDLDCPYRFECDNAPGGDNVCKPVSGCTTDEQCAAQGGQGGDATSVCLENKCVTPCDTDQDCADSGNLGGGAAYNSMVCNAAKVCESLGCTTNDECMRGGLRMFCVEAPAAGTGAAVDAITD